MVEKLQNYLISIPKKQRLIACFFKTQHVSIIQMHIHLKKESLMLFQGINKVYSDYARVALLTFFLASFPSKAQNSCCDVTALTSIPSPGGTSVDQMLFPADGCFLFSSSRAVTTATYNTSTCTFNTPVTTNFSYDFQSIAFIPNCNRLVIDEGAAMKLHIFSLTNCSLGSSEVQTVTTPFGPQHVAASPSGSCFAIAGLVSGTPTVATYTVDSLCNLSSTPVSSQALTVLSTTSHLAFSPTTSPCNFLVVTSGATSQPFITIPIGAGCTLGTAVSHTFGTGGAAAGIAFSPDGNCLAISYVFENVIRIFTINADCTLTPSQTISTGSNPADLAYSPDGSCLGVASSDNGFIYPVNVGCTVNATGVITVPRPFAANLAFSPLSTCNLLAFSTFSSQSDAFIYKRAAAPTLTIQCNPQICSVCAGSSITLTANSDQPVSSYLWSPGGETTPSITVSPTLSTTYTVNVTSTSGCTGSASQLVTVNPLPIVTFPGTKTDYCIGETIVLSASPTNGQSYIWTKPDHSTVITTTNTLMIPDAQLSDAGTYMVTVIDQNGCSGTGSIIITVQNCAKLSLFLCCRDKISSSGKVTFTVSLKNSGTGVAENIVATNILPSCFHFISGQGTDWVFSNQGETVFATKASLGAGETSLFSITAKAKCCSGQRVTTTTSVVSEGLTTPVTASCTSCVD